MKTSGGATLASLLLCTGCCGPLTSAVRAYGAEAEQHGAVVIRLIEACEKPDGESDEAKVKQRAACQQAKTSVEAWRASSKVLSEVQ